MVFPPSSVTNEALLAKVEAHTHELGRELFLKAQGYRPPLSERLQDWLMVRLMEDERFRGRLLRFIDALAALDFDRAGGKVKSLAQEYFGEPFPSASGGIPLYNGLLNVALKGKTPAFLVAWGARRMAKFFAKRFITPGGASEAFKVLEYLGKVGRFGSFDILGEKVHSREEATEYQNRYLDLIQKLAHHPSSRKRTLGDVPQLQISLKLSSLTGDFNPIDPRGTLSRIRGPLEEILEAARQHGISVNIDMEQYEYRDLTWYLFTQIFGPREPFGRWEDVGVVLQAYLVDSLSHGKEMIEFAKKRGVSFQVRLVKGAYWDYETIVAQQMNWPIPVYQDKGNTDRNFEELVWLLFKDYPAIKTAIGSHNLRSQAHAEAVREHLGLPRNAVEHQTLFRMAEPYSRAMAAMGWVERDYIPLGDLLPGMAYMVRRVLENTSQMGFLMKSRQGGEAQELFKPPPKPGGPPPPKERPPLLREDQPFTNYPPKRLFKEEERQSFMEALDRVGQELGATYSLDIGGLILHPQKPVPSINPSRPDQPVGWVHFAGLEETQQAIDLANEALPKWAQASVRERAKILMQAAALMRKERDALGAWIVYEGGKNWPGALADVDEAIDYLNYYSLQALRIAQEMAGSAGSPDGEYQPRGVVAVIPPWNFPLAIPCGMTSAALVAGNSVILKSAEQTPIIAHKLVELLHRAGVPKEALIHLPGVGEIVGKELVESPDVDMVAFTGSKAVGTWIYQAASGVNLRKGGIKGVLAEMGGKNAIVVFPDADLDEAVQGILQSAFSHANQKCSACSRVFIHRDIYERLKRRLIWGAQSLPIGPADHPGTFINPLITQEARDRVLACGDKARAEGRVLLDLMGQREGPGLVLSRAEGYNLGPLLVELGTEEAKTSLTAQEEIFGPVLPLIPFEDEDEVLELVNGTVYGLTAGVFSRSPRTIKKAIDTIRAGNIYVNREITGARVGVEPFGGFQLSGTGPKAGGEDYLLAFMTRRQVFRADGAFEPALGAFTEPALLDLSSLRPWDDASTEERAARLETALQNLQDESLRQAVQADFRLSPKDAEEAVKEAAALLGRIIQQAPEVTLPSPTLGIPGQKTYLLWNTPRGLGLVRQRRTDEGTSLSALGSLIFGPLLAGNGLVVAPPASGGATAQLLVDGLHRAGVPKDVLAMAPSGSPELALLLAEEPFHFAAVDMSLPHVKAIYKALGVTKEGQTWLKALITLADGPGPGETGFLRRFTLPKTIAIRTLRHGADLELV